VWDIIKTLPNSKSPGPDKIPNTALKQLPKKTIMKLSNIFTACLRLSYFPYPWKTASIVMIPKLLKDHSEPDGYKPISLLSSMSKVFEKTIFQKLNPHVKIRNEQFAFRSGHSTTLQLLNLVDDITHKACKRKRSVAIFLDMAKTFDRVWHEGLIYKLHASKTPYT